MFKRTEPHPFKAKLRNLRIGQHDLAKFLGISQGLLSQYLLGYRQIPPDHEHKLAQLILELEAEQGVEHAERDR